MKSIAVLSEVAMELCYLTATRKTIGVIAISEDEVELYLKKTTSPEVASFIKFGVNLLKTGSIFSPVLKMYFDAKMMECTRNPNISIEELKAIQYSIYLFEHVQKENVADILRVSENIVIFEYGDIFSFYESSEEVIQKFIRTLRFLREKDSEYVFVDRKEYEDYKSEGWKHNVD